MPGLLFHPEFERHTTLTALSRCPREYWHQQQVRTGQQPELPPSVAALIGIGCDHVVTELWRQQWNPEAAFVTAQELMGQEFGALPEWRELRPQVLKEVQLFALQYVEQWKDVREKWTIHSLHPYMDETQHERLLLPLTGERQYLTMPDIEADVGDGLFTIVDVKTSKYDYDPERWAYEIQLMVNCLPALDRVEMARAGESEETFRAVQFLPDYAQRPHGKGGQKWTFPPTRPFVMDEQRIRIAQQWLHLCGRMLEDETVRNEWAHNPVDGCQRWYGRCHYWDRCLGADNG